MRQRQIREQELARQERRSRSKDRKQGSPKRFENRAHSRDRMQHLSSDVVDKRPTEVNAYSSKQSFLSPEKRKNSHRSSRMKRSSSLGELSEMAWDQYSSNRSTSITQLPHAKPQGSGPSSSSSCGTVVSNKKKMSAALNPRYPDLDPLPSHLEDIVIETESHVDSRSLFSQASKLSAQSRQSSRISVSNSFETVIASGRGLSVGKDSLDTEDELCVPADTRLIRRYDGWTGHPSEERDLGPLGSMAGRHQLSGNSSLPSTSDEDNERRRRAQRREETAEDTSTMESVQMIDRAKSFEYIPGESFPLQENSSSYEYLPGIYIY